VFTLDRCFPDWIAAEHPDRVAYILGDEAVTYRTLVDRSIKIAHLLRQLGLRRGDVVALLMPNIPGFLEVAWACQRSGLRYTAISSRLNGSEVAYILADSNASVLVSSAQLADLASASLDALPRDVHCLSVDGPIARFRELQPLMEQMPLDPAPDECEGVDLLYSSGTTGKPKGVEAPLSFLPIGTPTGSAPFLQRTWGFGEDSIYLSPAPLYHSAPLRFSMTVQRFGGTVIVMPKFDAVSALDLIERYRVTHTQMVPTMFVRLLQLPESVRAVYDTSSLRAVIHAAAPCPPAVKRAMIEWVGPIVDEYYSGTENNLLTFINSEQALNKPGSVGRPILGIPHILDAAGAEVPVGVPGEIWGEGGLEFAYLNDPEKTAASRNDRGWSTVGDLGYLDEDGFLYISDRRADLIISGGVNIYPLESENVLIEHPGVADVAVIGVPHGELGSEVKAVVQLRAGYQPSVATAEELLDFVRDRLSLFKCPRSIDFVAEIPRTPTGKLMRREVREGYLTQAPA
jgi:long-chain acyl-CoA synthetase